MNHLARILDRKKVEVERRVRRQTVRTPPPPAMVSPTRRDEAITALRRRSGEALRVIAEVKFRSPSAGQIRPWGRGEAAKVAQSYEANGASAVSVLADRPGFGSGPLDVRRAADAVRVPVLFKEFVIHEVQVDLARKVGASMVLLLVRALPLERLRELADYIRAQGLAPVVEAADADELNAALALDATIIGVNARDLATFAVDSTLAQELVSAIPEGRIAVYMSGVRSQDDLRRVAHGRADAVLIGEGLMRGDDPGVRLGQWLAS